MVFAHLQILCIVAVAVVVGHSMLLLVVIVGRRYWLSLFVGGHRCWSLVVVVVDWSW